MQDEDRIGQDSRHSNGTQSWAKAAQNHGVIVITANDKARDRGSGRGQDVRARGNIIQTRGSRGYVA